MVQEGGPPSPSSPATSALKAQVNKSKIDSDCESLLKAKAGVPWRSFYRQPCHISAARAGWTPPRRHPPLHGLHHSVGEGGEGTAAALRGRGGGGGGGGDEEEKDGEER